MLVLEDRMVSGDGEHSKDEKAICEKSVQDWGEIGTDYILRTKQMRELL